MSAIVLNNRVTTYADAAFVSCTALPIHQTTLNFDEMAGIDGLWDWGDFASQVAKAAVIGAIGGGVAGAVAGAISTAGPGALVGGAVGYISGFAGGA